MFRPVLSLVVLALMLLSSQAHAAREGRLLRFPDVHGDQVAFVYAGDVWVGSTAGGLARRLTSHEGMEIFPKFSPDGSRIAFSAEYSGNRQVYVMSAEGGEPVQLTFYNDVGPMPPRGGFDYRVLDWTPDGEHILVRANRLPWGVRMGRLYLVPAAGGMETPLAIPEAGAGMFSPDGKKLVYTPIDREFRTWKRYRGGRAQDVWIYDLENDASEQITDFPGTDNQPMWVGDRIYFASDREGGRLNLWSTDPVSKREAQVTDHADFDVLWPSAGPERIVYECGGYLYLFDPAAGTSARIPLEVTGDHLLTLPAFKNVSSNIDGGGISPSGKRAVFAARGDLFTVPAENGEIRDLTRSQGVRERSVSWSPDGRSVAYLSDRSGEYEIYLRNADGTGEERRLTEDGDTWRFDPLWSPDSRKIAYADKRQRLRYVEIDSGATVDVDRGESSDITTFGWSPDSRWLVYTKTGESRFSSLYLYSLGGGEIHRLTDGFTHDYEPVFDPEGRYLYFLSDRDYNLTFSGYEFNYFYTEPARIYAATLQKDGPALLRPKSDEEEPPKENGKENGEDDDEAAKQKKGKKKKGVEEDSDDAEKPLVIDVDGFADRVLALPVEAGDHHDLQATANGVLFLDDGALKSYSLEDEKTETILEDAAGYEASRDGKKVLYVSGGSYGIADLKPGQKGGAGKLDLSNLEIKIDPRAEWRQIFVDGWRTTRDWFYDPGMHGLDWQAIRELYEPMVEHVTHRSDLDYIFGEMGGELSAGHFYVNSGDMPRPERSDGGLLGAEIVADDSSFFRIEKIFPGENWHPNFRSPLTEAGVEAAEGDLILAVDGRRTDEVGNFYRLLEKKADRVVRLTVNDRPSFDGAREIEVRPIARETNLRYLDWVRERRERVDRLSGGRIGYIHLPNTGGPGNRELRKFFYPQAHKEALIFDVRYNGGGFIPDRMIELLARTRLSLWARRGVEPFSTPGFVHTGPKVCLMNAYSSSGGDAFPYYFRKMGLGKLLGTRTWGGLIGLSGNPGLVDGGSLSIPTFRFIDTEGNWAVEGEGVIPDIEVVDRPELVAQGQDPTLEKAVEVLLEELETSPPSEIEVPPAPRMDRSGSPIEP